MEFQSYITKNEAQKEFDVFTIVGVEKFFDEISGNL